MAGTRPATTLPPMMTMKLDLALSVLTIMLGRCRAIAYAPSSADVLWLEFHDLSHAPKDFHVEHALVADDEEGTGLVLDLTVVEVDCVVNAELAYAAAEVYVWVMVVAQQ